MKEIDDEEALEILTRSEFGHHAPFEFLYAKNTKTHHHEVDTRWGERCYVFHSKNGRYFYVYLDGTIKQGT